MDVIIIKYSYSVDGST